jgi:dynein intermediate chain
LSPPCHAAATSRRGKLSISEGVVVDVPGGSAVEMYEKVTQTETLLEDDHPSTSAGVEQTGRSQQQHDSAHESIYSAHPPGFSPTSGGPEQSSRPVEVISEAEWQTIQRSEDFGEFFWKSTRIMERALGLQEVYDILKDYSGDAAEKTDEQESNTLLLQHNTKTFYNPQLCAGRAVTCLAWSTHHPELLVAAYHEPHDAFGGVGGGGQSRSEAEGLVCVWNTRSGQYVTPEYKLTCETAVTALCLHAHSPQCFVGGTRVGQILLWDLRAKSTPVARSPPSVNCHIHHTPVVGIEMLGTQVCVCVGG